MPGRETEIHKWPSEGSKLFGRQTYVNLRVHQHEITAVNSIVDLFKQRKCLIPAGINKTNSNVNQQIC